MTDAAAGCPTAPQPAPKVEVPPMPHCFATTQFTSLECCEAGAVRALHAAAVALTAERDEAESQYHTLRARILDASDVRHDCEDIPAAIRAIRAERDALAEQCERAKGELVELDKLRRSESGRANTAANRNTILEMRAEAAVRRTEAAERKRDEALAELAEAQAALRDARRQERVRCAKACDAVSNFYTAGIIRALPEEEA